MRFAIDCYKSKGTVAQKVVQNLEKCVQYVEDFQHSRAPPLNVQKPLRGRQKIMNDNSIRKLNIR